MPKQRRAKRPTGVLKTREAVEASLGEYARLVIERDALAAEMDERLRQIRVEYEDRLADLSADADVEFDMVADWAARNPEPFGVRKSMVLTHGTIGYRTGMPKLKTKKGLTWSSVLLLLTQLKRFEYIRTKTEPDKDKLLADRQKLGKDGLDEMCVRVVQDETFYLEPKREEVEA